MHVKGLGSNFIVAALLVGMFLGLLNFTRNDFSPSLTIFGHKIALFSTELFSTKRDLISANEGQDLGFATLKHFQTFDDD